MEWLRDLVREAGTNPTGRGGSRHFIWPGVLFGTDRRSFLAAEKLPAASRE